MKCPICGNKLENNYCKKCEKVIGNEVKTSEIIKNNLLISKNFLIGCSLLFLVHIIFIICLIFTKINISILSFSLIMCWIIFLLSPILLNFKHKNDNILVKQVNINKDEEGTIEDILYFYYYEGSAISMQGGPLPNKEIMLRPIVRLKSDNKLIILDTALKIKKTENGFKFNNKEYTIGDNINIHIDKYIEDPRIIENRKIYLNNKEYETFSFLKYAYMGKWDKFEPFINTIETRLLYNLNYDDLKEKLLNSKLTGGKTTII